jgi:hypothetical protein
MKYFILISLLFLPSCIFSTKSNPPVVYQPVKIEIVPPTVQPITQIPLSWTVFEDSTKELNFCLKEDEYKNNQLNNQELKRYILGQKEVITFYQKITDNQK